MFFSGTTKVLRLETDEKGPGGEKKRNYFVFAIPKGFREASRWPGLKAIGVVIHETKRDGNLTNQFRYYILSRK